MGARAVIVGMSGAAGSGKDTAAKALLDCLDYRKGSFAMKLKMALNAIFEWRMEDWDSLEWKETPQAVCYGKTPRELAQSLGTDWGRDMVNMNLWVDAVVRSLHPTERAVFTDVRFPNEAEAIRNAGGILIHITCVDRPTGTVSDAHESESWLPWLEAYADCGVAAQFGEIDQLQEVTLNMVENYLFGKIPRLGSSPVEPERLEQMNALADQIRAKVMNA